MRASKAFCDAITFCQAFRQLLVGLGNLLSWSGRRGSSTKVNKFYSVVRDAVGLRVHFEFGREDSKSGGSGGGPLKKGKMTPKILADPESRRSSMRKLLQSLRAGVHGDD